VSTIKFIDLCLEHEDLIQYINILKFQKQIVSLGTIKKLHISLTGASCEESNHYLTKGRLHTDYQVKYEFKIKSISDDRLNVLEKEYLTFTNTELIDKYGQPTVSLMRQCFGVKTPNRGIQPTMYKRINISSLSADEILDWKKVLPRTTFQSAMKRGYFIAI
jgi:hypothetical protein